MIAQTACAPVGDSGQHSILDPDFEYDMPARDAWHEREFEDLTQVAELLDSLEVCAVEDPKLYTVGRGHFVVRWRA